VGKVGNSVRVQVGGGIRDREIALHMVESGAERVILGTILFEDSELARKIVDEVGGKRVMAALDARNGIVMVRGWKESTRMKAEEAGRVVEEMGVGSILFTNIDTEGLMRGVKVEPLRELVETVSIPVVASGGISSFDDILRLKEAGAEGVVVGSALYTGRLRVDRFVFD